MEQQVVSQYDVLIVSVNPPIGYFFPTLYCIFWCHVIKDFRGCGVLDIDWHTVRCWLIETVQLMTHVFFILVYPILTFVFGATDCAPRFGQHNHSRMFPHFGIDHTAFFLNTRPPFFFWSFVGLFVRALGTVCENIACCHF